MMITQSHPSPEVQRQERQQSRAWFFAWLTVAGLGAAVAIDAGSAAMSQYPTTHPDCATARC